MATALLLFVYAFGVEALAFAAFSSELKAWSGGRRLGRLQTAVVFAALIVFWPVTLPALALAGNLEIIRPNARRHS